MTLSESAINLYHSLATQLTVAKHGEKGVLVRMVMDALGVSKNTIYRDLAELGYKDNGRKIRADKGNCKVSDCEIQAVVGLIRESIQLDNKNPMTLSRACSIAKSQGLFNADISQAMLANVMRDRGVHPKQLLELSLHHPQYGCAHHYGVRSIIASKDLHEALLSDDVIRQLTKALSRKIRCKLADTEVRYALETQVINLVRAVNK